MSRFSIDATLEDYLPVEIFPLKAGVSGKFEKLPSKQIDLYARPFLQPDPLFRIARLADVKAFAAMFGRQFNRARPLFIDLRVLELEMPGLRRRAKTPGERRATRIFAELLEDMRIDPRADDASFVEVSSL
jgi:hypothetical protein